MRKKLLIAISSILVLASGLASCSFSFLPHDDRLNKFTYHDLGKRSASATYYGDSIGNGKTLVIPVTIKGYEENATEENREKIRKAFFGTSEETGWESVSSYFNKCSYGKYKLSGEVTPWFDSGLTKSFIASQNTEYEDLGTYYVLERAYAWARGQGIDMKQYDVNKDGWIDSIWMIYSCPRDANAGIGNTSSTFWAFTYWDYNYAINSPSPSTSNPMPNTYAWASFDFMEDGKKVGIDVDAHTYIHEHGHVLGLDDYYDYDARHEPLGGIDMQDYNIGDHNAFSKFAWGWVEPKYITEECEVTIAPTGKSGDCIVLANNWQGGAFDEYIMIDYINQENLWKQDSEHQYSSLRAFTEPGIRVMHVDARLAKINTKDGSVTELTNYMNGMNIYSVAFSNTPSRSYSTGKYNEKTGRYTFDDLICMVNKNHNLDSTHKGSGHVDNDCLFMEGDSFDINTYSDFINGGCFHNGSTISLKMSVVSLNNNQATLKFTKA